MPSGTGSLLPEHGYAHREGPDSIAGSHHQRPEIVVPVVDDAEKGESYDRPLGHGNQQSEYDRQGVRSVQFRCIDVIIVDTHECLPNQEDS